MSSLQLKQIRKSFGTFNVIHGVDLDIDHGEFVVFVGPSGCGKSTLLRLIAGLEKMTFGTLWIDGVNMTRVAPADRGVAMVFQSYALYPHMTVEENMGFGLKINRVSKPEIAERVRKASRILHIEELLSRKPKQLSGGQRQRVAIGRAIVREPNVFLFDEPLSNLDAELRVKMRLEIAKLHHELGATMIYVTHDQVEAMTLADKIVVLRAGRIEQIGTSMELYDNPVNMFVAGFIGSPKMNFLKARLIDISGGVTRVKLPQFGEVEISLPGRAAVPSGVESLYVGIRPEHFYAEGAYRLTVNVEVIENLGAASYAYARTNGSEPLTIEIRDNRSVRAGNTLSIGFDTADVFLFDPISENRLL